MHSSRMCTARSSSCQGGSASVHAGIHPPGCGPGDPQVWAWRPPRCGPGDPLLLGVGLETPLPDPSTSPLGVGLETCKACWDITIPWRPAARHTGIPPVMHAGIPPPWRPAARHAVIPPAMHAGIPPHHPIPL